MERLTVPILLSPKDLASLLSRKRNRVLVIDTRVFSDYQKGHIPGSANLPLMYYHWSDTSPNGIKAFNHQMERVLGFVGVNGRKHVVFYEDNSGMMASRGVWLLQYLGHNRTSLLDGGLRAWKQAGFRTTTKTTTSRSSRFHGKPHPEILATLDQVSRGLGNRGISLLDVRSPEEYDGSWVRAARRGHIPTAVNVNWEKTLTKSGRLKTLPELERMYREAGLTKEREVIAYCQGGFRAAQTYLVLKLLGYRRVRNYLGSWFEWSNSAKVPVEN